MSKRKNTRTSMDRLSKSKRDNQKLHTLASRQRRNIKHLTAIVLNTKRALEANDVLRAMALVSGNIKYPPSAAKGLDKCPDHGLNNTFVLTCSTCLERMD